MKINVKGFEVPALGLGTYSLRGSRAVEIVTAALDMGYRHIDTARMYGNEREVGQAVHHSTVDRSDVFITTKIWPDDLAYSNVLSCADDSLRNLNTDYVDLLLVHWPSKSIPLSETLPAFEQVRKAGKARLIGVSNFNTAMMAEAVEQHGVDIACNQVEYHPLMSQRRVLDRVRDYGMMLTAYKPIAEGQVLQEPILNRIGDQHGKTAAQVSLRWLIQQQAVAAIPKTGNVDRCRENLEIFDFSLTTEEMDEISTLQARNLRLLDVSLGPVWDQP
tara:strand:+ start:879 stop:1703 length:825 start_codon:yes stop_codon:yes gene_type:complete